MHRDRARGSAAGSGHARRLCRSALSRESGVRPLAPPALRSVRTTRSHLPVFVTNSAGQNIPTTQSRDFNETFLAQAQLSQLLFDFGKNLAATDAARKL